MPTLRILEGVKVEMFPRDHFPPHVHVSYGEFEELIEIETLATYAGKKLLPRRKREVVVKWMTENRSFLMEWWNRLQLSG
jgi:hypothetical protein